MKKINFANKRGKMIWFWLAAIMLMSVCFVEATITQAAEALVVIDKIEGQETPLLAPQLEQQVQPGMKRVVHYTVKNLENKAVKLQTGVVNASVDQSGQVMYDIRELPQDGQRKLLADFIRIEPEIAIEAKKEYRGQFEIELPVEPFAGIVSGAILFFEAGTDQVITELPVQLQEGEHLEPARIQLTDLALIDDAGEEQLAANLRNSSLNNGEKVLVKVALKDRNEKVVAQQQLDIPLFPSQSQFYWRIPLDYKQLKTGNYQMQVELLAPDSEASIIKQTVEVSEKDGKKHLRLPLEDHIEAQQHQQFWFALGGSCVLIVMGIGFWWYKKNQRSGQQESQKHIHSTKKENKKRREILKVEEGSTIDLATPQSVSSEKVNQLAVESKEECPVLETAMSEPEITIQKSLGDGDTASDSAAIVAQLGGKLNGKEETPNNEESTVMVEHDLTAEFPTDVVTIVELQKEEEKQTREERLAQLRKSRKHKQKKKKRKENKS